MASFHPNLRSQNDPLISYYVKENLGSDVICISKFFVGPIPEYFSIQLYVFYLQTLTYGLVIPLFCTTCRP